MTDEYLPATVDEVQAALDRGLVSEGHYYDLKRLVNFGAGPKANEQLAKDLAAFAIDGGVLFVGVDEAKDGVPARVSPIKFAGIKEGYDQVARSVPKPPIAIRTVELPLPDDPSSGVLLVVIPPSGDAPHMVAGNYWGRSDTTNYVLSDAEVTALHSQRLRDLVSIGDLLDSEIERDPSLPHQRSQAHLFVVAQPVKVDAELLVRAVEGGNLLHWVQNSIRYGRVVAHDGRNIDPDLDDTNQVSRRARGAAIHTYPITADRSISADGAIDPEERSLLDFEVLEDGGLRLFCAPASRSPYSNPETREIYVPMVVGLLERTLVAAHEVSKVSDYLGGWDLGIGLTNMRGVVQFDRRNVHLVRFSEDDYRRTARCSFSDLEHRRGDVMGQLLGRLVRALDLPLEIVASVLK